MYDDIGILVREARVHTYKHDVYCYVTSQSIRKNRKRNEPSQTKPSHDRPCQDRPGKEKKEKRMKSARS